ncbi:MAG: sulfotransferase domain-containing protein [Armatimonadota bacterium]|nr:sulfotransferase domain-containing protein [Armatimonadota bacterium]
MTVVPVIVLFSRRLVLLDAHDRRRASEQGTTVVSKPLVARIKARIPKPVKEAVLSAKRLPRLMTSHRRVLPDYIIFGAMRCGTSSLYHNLTDHPQVLQAFRKQLRFFDREFQRGLEWYRAHFPLQSAMERIQREAGGAFTGEASPEYIFHPLAPERISDTLPNVRLIALVRDPVERAWSHYKHAVRIEVESLPFEEALKREDERLAGQLERMRSDESCDRTYQDFSYISQGIYAEHLQAWFEHFPREQIMIVRSEDMFAEPQRVMSEVGAFIGLGEWTPDYRAFNRARPGDMPPEIRRRLTELFAPHNERLSELLGRDMAWDE